MNCTNCHLDQGRKANSAPLWGAYPMYPAYRKKNDKVNSYAERIQGCFQFSMNGKPPAADSHVINALTAYSYWLSTGRSEEHTSELQSLMRISYAVFSLKKKKDN